MPQAKYTKQIISILQNVHKKGIKHCDPAPRNWLINDNDEAILNDFGSCIVGSSEECFWYGANELEIPRHDLTRKTMTFNDDFVILIRSLRILFLKASSYDISRFTREELEYHLTKSENWKLLMHAAQKGDTDKMMKMLDDILD
jgi:serine/threonine protein kinase